MSATEAPPRSRTDAERRLVLSLAVLAAAVFLIVQEGGVNNYDGRTMYSVCRWSGGGRAEAWPT